MKEKHESKWPVTLDESKLLLLSVMVGALMVPVISSLSYLTGKYFTLFLKCENYLSPYLGSAWMLLPMAVGGLVVGILVHRVAPESEGPGVHVVIAAYHKRHGKLRKRTGIIKYISTLITVGSGTPSGLVSPSTLLGNSLANYIGNAIKIDRDTRKTLSLCGVAAAITGLVGAPVGAAIFAVEVVYGNRILYRRFFYCLVSSLTTYILVVWIGYRKMFSYVIDWKPVLDPKIVLYIIITAVVVTLVNIFYIFIYQKVHDFFKSRSWKGRNWLEPGFGMVIAAVIMAPLYPEMTSMGVVGGEYKTILSSTDADVLMLIGIILVVMVATVFITGTGASGGLFMPIMFLGNLLGLLIVTIADFPYPRMLAAAGISASLCTTLNIPLASIIIGVELFGPIALIPSIVGALSGYVLGKKYYIFYAIRWRKLE